MADETHYAFAKTARRMAMNDWGRKEKAADEAMRRLPVNDAGSAALLELVRRFNQAVRAWNNDGDGAEPEFTGRPEWAVAFPGLKPGDLLYVCDELDRGVYTVVVVSVDSEGYARTVSHVDDDQNKVWASWVNDSYFRTAAEALKDQAQGDIKYHKPRVDYARRVLAAVKSGRDLAEFIDPPEDVLGEDEQ